MSDFIVKPSAADQAFKIDFVPLTTEEYLAGASHVLSESFLTEPLNWALSVDYTLMKRFCDLYVVKCMENGLSMVAVSTPLDSPDTKEVVGVVICEDLAAPVEDDLEYEGCHIVDPIDEILTLITDDLTEIIQQQRLPPTVQSKEEQQNAAAEAIPIGKFLRIVLIGIESKWQGMGIGKELLRRNLKRLSDNSSSSSSFCVASAEVASVGSQKLFVNVLGFDVLKDYPYADFQRPNNPESRPFAVVTSPPSIQLVARSLSNPLP